MTGFVTSMKTGEQPPTRKPPKQVRVVCMSDTHDRYNQLYSIPDGDILIISGDMTFHGKRGELLRLNDWLDKQPHAHKVIIPGNHDLSFEKDWEVAAAHVQAADAILNQEMYEAEGLKIWGEPRQPWFHDWAFNVPRAQMKKECWDKVPDDTDILVTHGPPWGVGDLCRSGNVGCVAQREYILEKQPRLVVCGHIHEGYGLYLLGRTLVANASTCNSKYRAVNPPIVVNL